MINVDIWQKIDHKLSVLWQDKRFSFLRNEAKGNLTSKKLDVKKKSLNMVCYINDSWRNFFSEHFV